VIYYTSCSHPIDFKSTSSVKSWQVMFVGTKLPRCPLSGVVQSDRFSPPLNGFLSSNNSKISPHYLNWKGI